LYRLIASTDFAATELLVQEEASTLARLKEFPDSATAAAAGLSYIKYLCETWLSLSLWQSWSQYSRMCASTILKLPIQGVIPTTNHLEAFNCLLKRKHIHRWQHAGK